MLGKGFSCLARQHFRIAVAAGAGDQKGEAAFLMFSWVRMVLHDELT
jgi:hypothetical protein